MKNTLYSGKIVTFLSISSQLLAHFLYIFSVISLRVCHEINILWNKTQHVIYIIYANEVMRCSSVSTAWMMFIFINYVDDVLDNSKLISS